MFKNKGDGIFEEALGVHDDAGSLTTTILALGDINDALMNITEWNDGPSDQFLGNIFSGAFLNLPTIFPLPDKSKAITIAVADVDWYVLRPE